jgi:DNA-binding SARP family transcriptional activator
MTTRTLRTLGDVRLREGATELMRGRRKALVLLAYLAQRSPRAATRAELASLLWADRPEPRARHSLRQALHELREAVGEILEVSDDDVRVVDGGLRLDVAELEADVSAGRLQEAIERWHGEFLHGCDDLGGEAFRGWVEAERERARRLVVGALERLTADASHRGEWARATLWAEQWATIDRYSERAHACLAEALRLAGRREAADAVVATFAVRLRGELGEEPSAGLLSAGTGEAEERIERRVERAGSAALFTPDLIGRADAFAKLVDAWREVEQGAGAVVVVSGEAGIGRTRLCDEFLRWLGMGGAEALVLRAQAYPSERGVEWAAARDLLSPLAEAPGLGGASDRALAALSTIVPAIRERFPRLPPAADDGLTPELAVVRVLAAVAAELPLVICLDDLPSADAATHRLLLSLARRVPERLLLIVTGRTGENGFAGAVDPLREIGAARWLALARLSVSETEAMLASMLALAADQRAALALRLHAEGEGNPFYMIALVWALADSGRLAPDAAGIWRVSPDAETSLPVPASVRDAVRARLHHLSADGRQLIGAAAVLGRAFDAAMLRAVAALPPGRFADALEELVSRRLVRPLPPPSHACEFAHDLVRRVTYEELDPARRRMLHDAALDQMERSAGRDPSTRAAIQHHESHARRRARWTRRRPAAVAGLLVVAATMAATVLVRGESKPVGAGGVRPAAAEAKYREGLAAYHRGDFATAEGFFAAALRHDSTFTLAAFHAWRTRKALGRRVDGDTALSRGLRWIDDAPDPERLLTRALWADALQDPSRFALAESLAVRYPSEPDGHLLLGRAMQSRGDFLGAVPHLRRVIASDSLGLEGRSTHCRACDAYEELISAYALADSAAAGLRAAREWTERQPSSPRAWNALAEQLLARGRFVEATAARQTGVSLKPGSSIGPIFPAHLALRAGDWAAADSLLRDAAAGATDETATRALWWLTISLREQGRLREALETARAYRRRVTASHAAAGLTPRAVPYTAVIEAQVLFELGRYHAAAALFDSIAAAAVTPESRGATARARAWVLTHRATALAHAGDTTVLARLVEEIRLVGSESGYGRDWRLHHYARGLLLVRRALLADAEREFRQSVYSLPGGYSRVNLELARLLLARGRADEAVELLEAAMRGPLEASGLYLTRTELRLELATALESANRPERAAEHYCWVAKAWTDADATLLPRRHLVMQRLALLRPHARALRAGAPTGDPSGCG